MKFKLFFAGILLSVLPALNSCNGSGGAKRAGGDTEVTELRCRDLDDPEGVDRAVFSWQIESEADSIVQTALGDRNRFRRKGFEEWKSRRMVVRQTTFRPATERPSAGRRPKTGRALLVARPHLGRRRPTDFVERSRIVLAGSRSRPMASEMDHRPMGGRQSAALFPHRFQRGSTGYETGTRRDLPLRSRVQRPVFQRPPRRSRPGYSTRLRAITNCMRCTARST